MTWFRVKEFENVPQPLDAAACLWQWLLRARNLKAETPSSLCATRIVKAAHKGRLGHACRLHEGTVSKRESHIS